MQQPVSITILGGGTAGWITASVLATVLKNTVQITLVESEEIGTVGVGEATIPPIRNLNAVLGISDADLIQEAGATVKLAIRFEDWFRKGEQYYHTFGAAGKSRPFCHFHHMFHRAQSLGLSSSLWDYDLNYLCAEAGRFAQINSKDSILELPYAYHFDAGAYAKYLRKLAIERGVLRVEGKVEEVSQCPDSGNVTSLKLNNGQEVGGELFIDCSGFRGLLIEQTLKTGFEDWSHWLPCDRAIAIPSERFDKSPLYTRSIAHQAGWQWQIPLQHRNGNGHVYCSSFMSEKDALQTLMDNLGSAPIGEPNFIRFKTGKRKKLWNKNVVAIGLSGGFLEPLESTSIHLIQTGVTRLVHHLSAGGSHVASQQAYNAQSAQEYETIKDFLVLHYILNERKGEPFWDHLRSMPIPERLKSKIAVFDQAGSLAKDENDIFLESSWLQVMVGQGRWPAHHHLMANDLDDATLLAHLAKIREIKHHPVSQLPTHDEYIAHMLKSR